MGNRLLSLLLGSAALAATGGIAEAKTVVHVMHQGDPGWVKAYGDVAKRFEEANPDVDIELIYAPHDAYNEKFSAAVMATAPAGGWTARNRIIAAIAAPTASATRRVGSSTGRQASTPITAAEPLPTTADQGCASGLFGTAKSSTDEAPNGAIR